MISFSTILKATALSLIMSSTSVQAQSMNENDTSDYIREIQALKNTAAMQSSFKFFKQANAQNIEDLIELTEIPAPPFKEGKRATRFAEMLREAGLSDVKVTEVGNVIARRKGTSGEKTVAIVAHIDTVFPESTDVMVKVDGDTYTAPGIGDNTRGLVALLSLARAMQKFDIQTKADILFVGSVGEEGLGDLRGVKHLFRDGGPKIDSFIAIDGGGNDRLVHSAVGSHRYRITVKGPGGHSWGAFGLANPHHALGNIITEFAVTAPSATQSGPKTSFSVGRIGGGTSINSIAFESWMEIDMRSLVQNKLDDIDAILHEAVQKGLATENAARKFGEALTVDIKRVGKRPAGVGSIESPLVKRAEASMKIFGTTPKLSASSTDSNIAISKGIPAITISRGGLSGKAHSPDEWWQNKDSHVALQIGLLILVSQANAE